MHLSVNGEKNKLKNIDKFILLLLYIYIIVITYVFLHEKIQCLCVMYKFYCAKTG